MLMTMKTDPIFRGYEAKRGKAATGNELLHTSGQHLRNRGTP